MSDIQHLNVTEIQEWLISYLMELGLPPEEIDTTMAFEAHGLDSSGIVGMIGDLGEWTGCKLKPSIVYEYPSIEMLSDYLVNNVAVKS